MLQGNPTRSRREAGMRIGRRANYVIQDDVHFVARRPLRGGVMMIQQLSPVSVFHMHSLWVSSTAPIAEAGMNTHRH